MKELENMNKITNDFFDYIDKDMKKHTWTIQGKGTLNSDSLLLKYGNMTFYGTEKELDDYLIEISKDHSSFKVIGVFNNSEI